MRFLLLSLFSLPSLLLLPLAGPAQPNLGSAPAKAGVGQVGPWVPDLGNGSYKNPVLYADYSDPDVVRVGQDYYLTSSSFNMAPALPILHSRDLVNWTLIGHALPVQPPRTRYDQVQPGNGVWAPALRYHAGEFYLYYPDPDLGIFVTKASNPAGPWSAPVCVKAARGWIDPCPLWDDDGRAYLVHAFAGSRAGIKSVLHVSEMTPDGLRLLGEDRLVFDGHANHPTIEGPKFYKRGGYYYLFAPGGGVPTGWQTVLRSKTPFGPYEDKIVLRQGNTPVNGPHQGAWVDTPGGKEDWFLHFQDQGAYGRVVHLQPMRWQNDWPVIGLDPDGDGVGEPALTYRKPAVPTQPVAVPATSDDFARNGPGLQWQWQANPQPGWQVPVAPAVVSNGWASGRNCVQLACVPPPPAAPNLYLVPNLLLQKLPAEQFTATTQVLLPGAAPGDRAGLVVWGYDYAALVVTRQASGLELSLATCWQADKGTAEATSAPVAVPAAKWLHLRVAVRPGARCQFSYSLDGQQFTPLGAEFVAREGRWVGAKLGLFAQGAGLPDHYARFGPWVVTPGR